MLLVKIENTYADGHESTNMLLTDVYPGEEHFLLECWWADEVYPHTGDGHGIGSTGSCYTATILEAPKAPALVGETAEWTD